MEIILLIILLMFSIIIGYWLGQRKSNIEPQMIEIGTINKTLGTIETIIKDLQINLNEQKNNFSEFQRFLIGSGTRGRLGEQILKNYLSGFIQQGIVEEQVTVGSNLKVDFAWRLHDGKYIPIDSKFQDVNSEDLYNNIKKSIRDASKYQNLHNTIRFCILALPDSIYEKSLSLIGEAIKQNIILTSYSNCPYVAFLLSEQYKKETTQINEKKLLENLESLKILVRKIELESNTIAKSLKAIEGANEEIGALIKKAKQLDD